MAHYAQSKRSIEGDAEDTVTGYEKMIRILHQKDMTLLEASVADDYLWIYEMKMWTKDDFIKQMSELFQTNIVRDRFFEEKCLYEDEDVVNYTRLEKEENGGILRITGTILLNEEGKFWRSIEKGTKIQDAL